MHSGCTTRGDPGGGKWNYDLPQMLQVQERSKIISDVSGWRSNRILEGHNLKLIFFIFIFFLGVR